jgi:hypothetical protein
MNSSMPKLSSTSEVPSSATATPGAANQYQPPEAAASLDWAQKSIEPQLHGWFGSIAPTKARAT